MRILPLFAMITELANLAHLVEQRTRNAQVFGSSPEVGFNLSVSFGGNAFFVCERFGCRGLEPSGSINFAARRSIDEAKTAVAPPFFYASSIFGGFKSGSWLRF